MAKRGQLATLGIEGEFQRSPGTKDQRLAEQQYVKVAAEQEAQWQRWRGLLANGLSGFRSGKLTGSRQTTRVHPWEDARASIVSSVLVIGEVRATGTHTLGQDPDPWTYLRLAPCPGE